MNATQRRLLILTVVVLVAAAFGVEVVHPFSLGKKTSPTAGGLKIAPDFTLKKSDGSSVSIGAWKDEMVIVHFWASWCPPCVPEIPDILAAAKRLPKDKAGRPIHWILVSEDQTWEKAHTVLHEETLPENVVAVLDPDAVVSDLYGTYQFPETYLLTRDHGIGAKWIGAQDWTGKWGEEAIPAIESTSRFNQLPGAPPQ